MSFIFRDPYHTGDQVFDDVLMLWDPVQSAYVGSVGIWGDAVVSMNTDGTGHLVLSWFFIGDSMAGGVARWSWGSNFSSCQASVKSVRWSLFGPSLHDCMEALSGGFGTGVLFHITSMIFRWMFEGLSNAVKDL